MRGTESAQAKAETDKKRRAEKAGEGPTDKDGEGTEANQVEEQVTETIHGEIGESFEAGEDREARKVFQGRQIG